MALLRRLSTATAVATLAAVAIGGVVRATGSGDACPDWPRCFGRWIPPLEFPTLIEYSHRLSVAVAGMLIFATAWVAWRRVRGDGGIVVPALLAPLVFLLQAGIGAGRIWIGPNPAVVTIHFLAGMGLVAVVLITATTTRVHRRQADAEDVVGSSIRRLVVWGVVVVAILLAIGAYVRGEQAGLAFLDWPLMDGRLIPDLGAPDSAAGFLHRAVAGVAMLLAAAVAWRGRSIRHGGVRAVAWTAFALLVVQAGIGAAAVLSRLEPAARAAHVAGSSLAWGALVVLATAVKRLTPAAVVPTIGRRARETVGAYVQLLKPDIIVLLLITTVPAMILAAHGLPPSSLIAATLLGGTLAAGGANALNCYVDRDIDTVMSRTRRRPIPSHRVEPTAALWFGLTLIGLAFAFLWTTVNLLAATLAVAAAGFYVLVYTAWLKRSTPQNIVIGGAAGAVPALVGWAAVTGDVGPPALILFAIVFMWTPPHFWALALRHADDYRRAGVPMLPSVRGRRTTAIQIVLYSVALVATSLLLWPAAGLGLLYVVAASGLGVTFIWFAVRVLRDTGTRAAMALFRFSITYLGLVFAAAAVDELIGG
ncbi:MAG: heme o synthase [Actinomycetota bacterium]|nr:heme o synthase [Actinomycetota bacterium]